MVTRNDTTRERRPCAYIAAPFTLMSTVPETSKVPHGIIPDGQYKSSLLQIEKALTGYGLDTFLPHRDVNQWGRRIMSPESVATLCTEQVAACDLFVGILGSSCGAHYELGLAIGMRKPTIILHCDEIPDSFVAQGIDVLAREDVKLDVRILVLSCRNLSDVYQALISSTVDFFLLRTVFLSAMA